jgi:hypothetical protein
VLGLPLSTYTAALITNTAVPVWHEARRTLPFVFGSGAALSAGAIAVAVTPPRHARPARRLALGGATVEIGCNELMKRRLGEHGRPYHHGAPRVLGYATSAFLAGGAGLLAARGGSSRAAAAVAGTMLCAGALTARLSIFRAGFASAAQPASVIGPQRAAIDRGDRRGASRRDARVQAADPALGSPATAPADPTQPPATAPADPTQPPATAPADPTQSPAGASADPIQPTSR